VAIIVVVIVVVVLDVHFSGSDFLPQSYKREKHFPRGCQDSTAVTSDDLANYSSFLFLSYTP